MVSTRPEISFDVRPADGRVRSGCGSCGSGCGNGGESRCGNGLEKIYPTTAVRFGYMRYIGEFSHPSDMKFTCGAKVVIQSRRGLEMGEQVSLTCSGCDKSVTREQMKEWVRASGEESFIFDAGRILREATAGDLAEYSRIRAGCTQKKHFAQEVARGYGLPLRILECEPLFGGERLIFFFSAPERIDFRELVRDLAKEYRTRIEMRQVGARDEARLLADYETCGREVCCKVFLKTLRPISMRMAKVQKATLDPSQVSGRCGRLKCCLRYEHTSYEELDKRLPKTGIRIRTAHGEGVVVNRQILTQLVQIRTDTDAYLTVVAEDITDVNVKPPPAGSTPTTTETDARGRGQRTSPLRSDRSRERRLLRDESPPDDTDAVGEQTEVPPEGKAEGETEKRPSGDESHGEVRSVRGRHRRRGRRRRRPAGGNQGEAGPRPDDGP